MREPPPSVRALATGVTESGKSYLLRKLFVDRAPRVLVLDLLGEYSAASVGKFGQKYYEADSVSGLRSALRRAVSESQRWQVVARVSKSELELLAPLLTPEGDRSRSLGHAVGGFALVTEEMDVLAPTSCPEWVESLMRRGRHYGISVLGATQRPHGIAPIVRAMIAWLIVTQTHEPRDLDQLSRWLPAEAFSCLDSLPWQWSILCNWRNRQWWLLDREQRVQRSHATLKEG